MRHVTLTPHYGQAFGDFDTKGGAGRAKGDFSDARRKQVSETCMEQIAHVDGEA